MYDQDQLVDLFHELIEEYIFQQFVIGRLFVMEDEIYRMLGYNLPPDRPNRRFQLRGGKIDSFEILEPEPTNNIINFLDYKKVQ